MKNLLIISTLLIFSCEAQLNENGEHTQADVIESLLQDLNKPTCPKNHQDSIVPIIYGYPSEEMFAKSDSGLVVLGGCELMEEQNFCKIHKISF
jgi:hypothetical protein